MPNALRACRYVRRAGAHCAPPWTTLDHVRTTCHSGHRSTITTDRNRKALDHHRTTFAHQQTILALQLTRPGAGGPRLGPNHSPRGLACTSPPAENGTGTATWTAHTCGYVHACSICRATDHGSAQDQPTERPNKPRVLGHSERSYSVIPCCVAILFSFFLDLIQSSFTSHRLSFHPSSIIIRARPTAFSHYHAWY